MKFAEATAVKQIDSHTYEANFDADWTIGTVPHGGYVTACFQQVVSKHFRTTLKKLNQPHTITLHLDFLRRTEVGPARFVVKDIKTGRQTSIVHVTLSQGDREEVVGYITNSNIDKETGASYPTGWEIHPRPPPADVTKLDTDSDELWGERFSLPFAGFRKASERVRWWFPRKGQHCPAIVDQWLALADPQDRWTNESLGFVADMFPQILESYLMGGLDVYGIDFERSQSKEEQERKMDGKAKMWYPTGQSLQFRRSWTLANVSCSVAELGRQESSSRRRRTLPVRPTAGQADQERPLRPRDHHQRRQRRSCRPEPPCGTGRECRQEHCGQTQGRSGTGEAVAGSDLGLDGRIIHIRSICPTELMVVQSAVMDTSNIVEKLVLQVRQKAEHPKSRGRRAAFERTDLLSLVGCYILYAPNGIRRW